MASGAKLPNTNLNLIQDIDMIDHADINAIAQAVEATTKVANRTSVSNASPSVLDWAMQRPPGLHYFTTDSGTTDVPGGQFMYSTGVLMVRTATQRTVVIVSYSTGQIISNTHVNGAWGGWSDAMGVQTSLSALANGTDLHTLEVGRYSLGGVSGSYVNGLASMYGLLDVKKGGAYKYMTFHNVNNTFWIKTYDNTKWSDWRQI